MRTARSISPTVCLYRSDTDLKRLPLALVPENHDGSQLPVLNCLPFSTGQGKYRQFQSFDEPYLERLRAGDVRTQEHFGAYFSALIQVKLRSRLQSREAVEDARQESLGGSTWLCGTEKSFTRNAWDRL